MSEPDNTRDSAAAGAEPTPAAPPPRERRRGGFLPGILGGVLGSAAVIGGGGWWAYEQGPLKPFVERYESTEAAARSAETTTAALQGQLAEVQGGLAQLQPTLGELSSRLEQLETGLRQEIGAAQASLGDRMTDLEQSVRDEIAQADAAAQQAVTTVQQTREELNARMERIGTTLVEVQRAQPADIVDKGMVSDLASQQSGLQASQTELEQSLGRLEQLVAGGLDASNKSADALRVVVDQVRSRLDELRQQQEALTSEVSQRQQGEIATLADRLAQAEATNQQQAQALADADAALESARAALDEKLSQIVADLKQLDAQRERGVGLAVASQGLDAALDTGAPFTQTIRLIDDLAAGDEKVAQLADRLRPLAESGIPTIATLAQQLAQLKANLTPAPSAEADSWLAKTTENLSSLIRLPQAPEEQGPGPGTVDAATEALLVQDLRTAVDRLWPLAEAGNAEAVSWISTAQSRLAAREAIDELRVHVKQVLAQQG